MKPLTHVALQIFRLFVGLYPQPFRSEFGDEMQLVFATRLAAAAQQGRFAVIALCAHESHGLLAGLVHEQLVALRSRHHVEHTSVGIIALACAGVALLLAATQPYTLM